MAKKIGISAGGRFFPKDEELPITAENATNAIKNSDGTYSGLTQENNVLKIGSEIIEKKVLLYEAGELDANSYTVTLPANSINVGDKIEVEYVSFQSMVSSGSVNISNMVEIFRTIVASEPYYSYGIPAKIRFVNNVSSSNYFSIINANQNAFNIQKNDSGVILSFREPRTDDVHTFTTKVLNYTNGSSTFATNLVENITEAESADKTTYLIKRIYKIIQ